MAKGYEITLVEEWTFLNPRGNPVEGYRVSFTSAEGYESYVHVERDKMKPEQTDKLILAEIERIRAIYAL